MVTKRAVDGILSEGQMLKIWHFIACSAFSGPVSPTLLLAEGQQKMGHRVWFSWNRKRDGSSLHEEAIAPHIPKSMQPICSLQLNTHSLPWQTLIDAMRLAAFLRRHPVDVLHVHQSYDHLVVGLARALLPKDACGHRPILVRTVHADKVYRRPRWQAHLLPRPDAWIVRSKAAQAEFKAWLMQPLTPVKVIAGSIKCPSPKSSSSNNNAEHRQRWRQALGIPPSAPVVLHAALMARRGQEELLEAAWALRDHASNVHWVLAGDGPQKDALAAKVAKEPCLQERVRMVGYWDRDSMAAAYAAVDAVFVGRLGNDASGRAVMEAMVAGCWVMAPKISSLEDILDERYGVLLPEVWGAKEITFGWDTAWKKHKDWQAWQTFAQGQVRMGRDPDTEATATATWYREMIL